MYGNALGWNVARARATALRPAMASVSWLQKGGVIVRVPGAAFRSSTAISGPDPDATPAAQGAAEVGLALDDADAGAVAEALGLECSDTELEPHPATASRMTAPAIAWRTS